MRKALIITLLLFLIPMSGQAYTSQVNKFYGNIIRAHGWKCDEVEFAWEGISPISRVLSAEIKCKNGKVYYFIDRPFSDTTRSMSICHKGVCKKTQMNC